MLPTMFADHNNGRGGGGGGHARTDASALEQVPLVSTEQAFWMLA